MKSNCNGIGFTYECSCEEKGILWVFAKEYNLLCKLDIKSGLLVTVSSVPGYDFFQKRLFGAMIVIDSKIILAPMNADEVALYNVKENKWSLYPIDYSDIPEHRLDNDKFYSMAYANNKVWIFGCSLPVIISFSVETGEMCYFTDWFMDVINNNEGVLPYNYFGHHVSVVDDYIYLPILCISAVLRFNILSTKSKLIMVAGAGVGFLDISYGNGRLWILPIMSRNIISYDVKSGELGTIRIKDESCNYSGLVYLGILYWNGYIILSPVNGNRMVIIYLKNMQQLIIENQYLFEKPAIEAVLDVPISDYTKLEYGILICYGYKGRLAMMNMENGHLQIKTVKINQDSVRYIIIDRIKSNDNLGVYNENMIFDLPMYIESL